MTLKFWRWLNVEQPAYDHASFGVSNDGVELHAIWANDSEIEDNAWIQQEFDISRVADGQATVYSALDHGPTDGSWQYSGWNIDDVEIWGLGPTGSRPSGEMPGLRAGLGEYPEPLQPVTKIEFTLDRAGSARCSLQHPGPAGATLVSSPSAKGPTVYLGRY